jgi:hypothetical protein
VYLSLVDGPQPTQLYFRASKRALTRARAIELDFTDGEDEEDTMCPVCHESTPLLHPPVRLKLIHHRDLVYENNGRILKCGHEVCAGELRHWTFLSNLHYSVNVLQTVWKI